MNEFKIIPADSFIWNKLELLKFLSENQDKDIALEINEEGCCLRSTGLYDILSVFDFKSVNILTNNILETHNQYIIENEDYLKFFTIDKVDYAHLHCWNKNKLFGAFYNRALWHRIGLASQLLSNYSSQSLINFRSNPHSEDSRRFFELQKLFELCPESATKFINLINQLPIRVEDNDSYTAGATTKEHTNQLCQFYPNILIDIVAETFVSGRTFFATEKTVRPMLLKKPFIIMGSKNFMIYLRQMGFKTFYEYWDENYDGFDGKERYLQILDIIKTIANKSNEELNEMYESMQDILDHNYNLLITQSYSKNISYVE